jgi:hypothetical protein
VEEENVPLMDLGGDRDDEDVEAGLEEGVPSMDDMLEVEEDGNDVSPTTATAAPGSSSSSAKKKKKKAAGKGGGVILKENSV